MKCENCRDLKVGKYQIVLLGDRAMKGYEGMNPAAAKAMGFLPVLKPNQIAVDKRYTGGKRREIIKHEIKEYELMKKGLKYFQAHAVANTVEKSSYRKILGR